MFLLKKILTSLLVPPGLFIILLLLGAFFNRRYKKMAVMLLLLCAGLYLASITPVANYLLAGLESRYALPTVDDLRASEAIVVLGGGTQETAADLFGSGVLSPDSTARMIAAYRLYRMAPKLIIISGGPGYPGRIPESETEKRFLAQLGVKSDHIIVETRSRDTFENAVYTKELCTGKGIERIVLVTSAYHLKRAILLFSPHFENIRPCPAGFMASLDKNGLRDYLPNIGNYYGTSIALRERLGILFYEVRSWVGEKR